MHHYNKKYKSDIYIYIYIYIVTYTPCMYWKTRQPQIWVQCHLESDVSATIRSLLRIIFLVSSVGLNVLISELGKQLNGL